MAHTVETLHCVASLRALPSSNRYQPDRLLNALLIMAHGSRREASNEEVVALAQRLSMTSDRYDHIGVGFLELSKPSIQEGAAQLIAAGTDSLTLLPYFLVAGRHVAEDIPAEVELLRQTHPNIDITLLDYFGASGRIDALVLALAES